MVIIRQKHIAINKPYFLTFRKAREEQARLLFRAKETSAQANVKRSRHAWRLQFLWYLSPCWGSNRGVERIPGACALG